MARGGPRPNSGRKSKAEELGLASMLNKAWPESSRLKFFKELAKLAENPRTAQGMEAGKLLAAYTYGKPREQVELSGNQENPIIVKGYISISPDDWNIQPSAMAGSAVAGSESGDAADR